MQKDKNSNEIINSITDKLSDYDQKEILSRKNETGETEVKPLVKPTEKTPEVKAPRTSKSFTIESILASEKDCSTGPQVSSKIQALSGDPEQNDSALTLAKHSACFTEEDRSSCSPTLSDSFWTHSNSNLWHAGLVDPFYVYPYSFGSMSPTMGHSFSQLPCGTGFPALLTPTMNSWYYPEQPFMDQVLMTDVTSNYVTVMFKECGTDRGFFRPR